MYKRQEDDRDRTRREEGVEGGVFPNEPGEEQLLTDATSSQDLGGEGLTTLDTLADDQRKATDPQHSVGDKNAGRHELRED